MNDNVEKIKSNSDLWNSCLIYIKDRITDQAYQTWFSGISLSSLTNQELIIQVPNKFHFEWLESKYRLLIDDAVKSVFSKPLIVNYSVVISEKNVKEIPNINESRLSLPKNYHNKSFLNKSYTFENYIEGKGNQMAKAAALSVSENLGSSPFNPLLIYSHTGLGKTHLLQSIGNYIIRKNSNLKITYLTSEKFMHDFIKSIQQNKTTDFANLYRKSDLLLIDDVQFFEGKEQTQEQFFHLFNDLHQKGKQIVLTMDRHPSELLGIKERLVSRFKSGLTVDIHPPDLETRIAILMRKADLEHLDIPFSVTEFLASSIRGNVRDLEGALTRILAISTLSKQDVNLSLAKQVIKDLLGKDAFKEITIERVISYVSSFYNISEKLISGKGRKQDVVLARQVAMFLSREFTGSTLAKIGSYFGKRDHSTVIHACGIIENKIKKEKVFNSQINKLIYDIENIK